MSDTEKIDLLTRILIEVVRRLKHEGEWECIGVCSCYLNKLKRDVAALAAPDAGRAGK